MARAKLLAPGMSVMPEHVVNGASQLSLTHDLHASLSPLMHLSRQWSFVHWPRSPKQPEQPSL